MPAIRPVPLVLLSWMLASGVALAADGSATAVPAQIPPPANVAVPDAAPATVATGRLITVPAGTELAFEMVDSLSSKTSQRGDRFSLKLTEPLTLDGQRLVPAGTLAVGEVVHADRAKAGGQAGELVLAARYLDWDGRQLPLKAFRTGLGRNRTDTAMGVMIAAGVAGFLVRGGQIEIAAGSPITATLREAVELPVLAPVVTTEPATAEADGESAATAAPEVTAASEAAEEAEVPAAAEAAAIPATPATPATTDTNDTIPGETEE
ncbi:hypothetical protein [Arenimonas terrae]|uniref:TrbI/VirB10 family protein n=1 Tax=Arenimonas terrae TaxID=2546226 RepID=A0A5C4RPD7_9GAMM|nr:hypothetical protein [Arenimonas terrae]TNJ32814.1 hypothetical protein E1B00_13950 [Arenimonas terrae]